MTKKKMYNEAFDMFEELGKLDERAFNYFHDWFDSALSQLGYLEDDETELASRYFECIKSIHKSALEMDKAYKLWIKYF